MLATLGVPQRRLLRRGGRRRLRRGEPEAEPVPTSRATIVRAEPFADEAAAAEWLAGLRGDRKALAAEVDESVEILNRVLRAHRAAAADPYVREVRGEQALARRVGYGVGAAVANGSLDAALDVGSSGRRRRPRAERLSPQERLAETLSGRRKLLACEELVLRARLDLDARRGREAALQARIALEALLAELADQAALQREGSELEHDRQALAAAANAALDGELDEAGIAAVEATVARMERTLVRHGSTGR